MDQRAAPRDDRPIFHPEPRQDAWPAQPVEAPAARPVHAPLWRPDEHDDWDDDPVSPPPPQPVRETPQEALHATGGTGWREVDQGVLHRPDAPSWPSPAAPAGGAPDPTSGGAYPVSGGAYPTSGGAYPVSGGAYPTNGVLVQDDAPWTPDPVPLPRERRRSPLVALLVILVVAVLGGVTAAVVSFVAARPDPPAAAQQTSQAPAPSTAAPSGQAAADAKAPGSLKLRDDKTSITLTWTDPSKGSVPFIVAGGQQGALRQLQVLAAGATTYTLNGLNPKLDYCFTVAAIYGTDSVALSDLACTQRR